MKKEMREAIYILIAISIFIVAYCICFRAWADKEVFVHRACFKRYVGSAVLVDKSPNGFCYWKPSDRPRVDERWGTCDEYEIGEVNNNYPEASFDCQ